MRTRTAYLTLAFLLSCAIPIRAEEYTPSYDRIRAGLDRTATPLDFEATDSKANELKTAVPATTSRRQDRSRGGRDSVWNGVLLGAAAGAGGGYVWARNICGSNDSECFYIAGPIGVLAGAGIGAAVGAIVDALHR